MHNYITGELKLNFPAPDVAGVAAYLEQVYDGVHPVSAYPLAKAFGVPEATVTAVLLRAERAGMVRYVEGQGWVPTNV